MHSPYSIAAFEFVPILNPTLPSFLIDPMNFLIWLPYATRLRCNGKSNASLAHNIFSLERPMSPQLNRYQI